jgi:hypothetical protein
MSRAATSRLKVNPPLGMRPSLEFRRPAELQVDPAYQRTIEAAASQTLIRRIAMFWDWSLCQPLAVAKRDDGTLMVVDGQHRLAAARLRGDIEDLPCVVTAYRNAGDEAAAFVALNQQRRPLGKIDLFKAALAAEDETAGTIARLLTEAGLRIAPHTNFTAWKPRMVSNVAGIEQGFRGHGEKATGLALKALAAAYPNEVLRYAGTLYPGIVGTVSQELRIEGRIDLHRLAAAIASKSQADWRTAIAHEAAAAGVERRVAARAVVAKAYRAPRAVAAEPASAPSVALPGEAGWCDQCDRRVDEAQATACRSPFCKAKARAA